MTVFFDVADNFIGSPPVGQPYLKDNKHSPNLNPGLDVDLQLNIMQTGFFK